MSESSVEGGKLDASREEQARYLESLRKRTRRDLRDESVPLVVIGAVLFVYATIQFGSIGAFPAILGLPAAFVIVWGISRQRAHEAGLGGGDTELVVAFAVFTLLALNWSAIADLALNTDVVVAGKREFTLRDAASEASSYAWPTMVVGGGLAALGWIRHRSTMVICGVGVVFAGLLAWVFWTSDVRNAVPLPQVLVEVAALATIVVGIVASRRHGR
ncbi:MAG: hypothetical protein GY812_10140 [Actinomycetia bacterium]|nr:hypothetical protein [Actinomycetes bacterium]